MKKIFLAFIFSFSVSSIFAATPYCVDYCSKYTVYTFFESGGARSFYCFSHCAGRYRNSSTSDTWYSVGGISSPADLLAYLQKYGFSGTHPLDAFPFNCPRDSSVFDNALSFFGCSSTTDSDGNGISDFVDSYFRMNTSKYLNYHLYQPGNTTLAQGAIDADGNYIGLMSDCVARDSFGNDRGLISNHKFYNLDSFSAASVDSSTLQSLISSANSTSLDSDGDGINDYQEKILGSDSSSSSSTKYVVLDSSGGILAGIINTGSSNVLIYASDTNVSTSITTNDSGGTIYNMTYTETITDVETGTVTGTNTYTTSTDNSSSATVNGTVISLGGSSGSGSSGSGSSGSGSSGSGDSGSSGDSGDSGSSGDSGDSGESGDSGDSGDSEDVQVDIHFPTTETTYLPGKPDLLDSIDTDSSFWGTFCRKFLPHLPSVSGSNDISIPIDFDLSGFPVNLGRLSFVLGGFHSVLDGALVPVMAFCRAFSIFLFVFFFSLSIVRALRQW